MSEEKNIFENSPTEQIGNPAATETEAMPTVDPAVTPTVEEQPQDEQKPKKGAIVAIAAIAVAVAAGIGIAAATGAFSPAPDTQAASNTVNASTNAAASTNTNASANEASNTNAAPENAAASEAGKAEDPASGTSSGNSGSQAIQGDGSPQPSSGGGASTPAQKQKVWVVDVPAHTETIHHPAEGYWEPGRYYTRCTVCGVEVGGQGIAHIEANHGGLGGWTDDVKPAVWHETKAAWDEQVSVPEQGHWEWR